MSFEIRNTSIVTIIKEQLNSKEIKRKLFLKYLRKLVTVSIRLKTVSKSEECKVCISLIGCHSLMWKTLEIYNIKSYSSEEYHTKITPNILSRKRIIVLAILNKID